MKFSIIVVSYNAGIKLRATIESCLNQTYKNFEIIVKDACSSDGSMSFFDNHIDERINIIQSKDHGIYDGMNQAIKYISGNYVIFMNCGDSFYNNKVLEDVASHLCTIDNKTIYFGDCYVVSRKGVVYLPEKWDDYCCYRYTICHQAMFYSADVLKEHNFNTKSTISACITHYIEMYAKYNVKLIHLPLIICNYEGGGVSDTSEGRKASLAAQYDMLRDCFGSKHRLYMCKMAISGQLLKQRISMTPCLHNLYEFLASIVYSRR